MSCEKKEVVRDKYRLLENLAEDVTRETKKAIRYIVFFCLGYLMCYYFLNTNIDKEKKQITCMCDIICESGPVTILGPNTSVQLPIAGTSVE